MAKLVLPLIFILFILTSCSKNESSTVDCSGVNPTYTADIAAIMNSSCALSGCHSAIFPASGVNLSNYSNTKAASQNSKFLKSIKHESGAKPMPQGSAKLSDASIRLIECWIKNGAPE
ncbi:MAG: hypothetical protein IPM26_10040 [Saprospiraceae bacterium]|nr:hypothetical protein [Saprospiraceae bacterium]